MKIINRQSMAFCIALLLIITIVPLSNLLLTAQAQTIERYPEWIFTAAAPDPVGVGQPVMIVSWTLHMPPDIGESAGLVAGGRASWKGLTVTVTKPDETAEIINLPTTDSIGSAFYSYVPDQTGTYSIQAHVPAQWKNTTTYNRLYEAADSEQDTFTVTEKPLQIPSGVPLPTDYWTRPIDAGLREWSTIGGNWLLDGKGNRYTTAPETAHIAWTKPLFFGGIVGGSQDDKSYYTGSSYEGKWNGAVIMQGTLYYNQPLSSSTSASQSKLTAIDLRSGEQLWVRNATSMSMGTLYEYDSPNQHGVHPYLWISGNTIIDPFSGDDLFKFTTVPSGTEAVGSYGERLIYQWDLQRGWLALWNFSAATSMLLGATGTNYWQWRPVGKTINGTSAYSWNVSIPTNLGPRLGRDFVRVVYDATGMPEMIVGSSGCVDRWMTNDPMTMYALSLKQGQIGQLLWKTQFKMPFPNATVDPGYGMVIDPENRVFVLPVTQKRHWYGFDLDSGQQIWGPTESQPQYDYFRMYPLTTAVDGKFYAGSYSGVVHAYDTKTGNLLWKANTSECGLEGPYENWPMYSEPDVVDGKIYVKTDEHSQTHPLYRSWRIFCFDTETGAQVWNITGIWRTPAFADGYMISFNEMDNQIYAFGKGQTATSVTAPDVSIEFGKSVLIKGTIMDASAGTKSPELVGRFPKGVPAIADNYMTSWMEHVYKQQVKPTDAMGVEVTLDVIDANGNYRNIGKATSDVDGFYSFEWQPDIEGKYTVIANFEGSESYWPSHAETAFVVEAAAPTPTAQPAVALPPTEMYVLGIGVAIIIAIAIVGSILFMAIKRRP